MDTLQTVHNIMSARVYLLDQKAISTHRVIKNFTESFENVQLFRNGCRISTISNTTTTTTPLLRESGRSQPQQQQYQLGDVLVTTTTTTTAAAKTTKDAGGDRRPRKPGNVSIGLVCLHSVHTMDIDESFDYGQILNNFLEIYVPSPIRRINLYFGFDLDPMQTYISTLNKFHILNRLLQDIRCKYQIILL